MNQSCYHLLNRWIHVTKEKEHDNPSDDSPNLISHGAAVYFFDLDLLELENPIVCLEHPTDPGIILLSTRYHLEQLFLQMLP